MEEIQKNEKNVSRGGWRPNSGRKPILNKKNKCVTLQCTEDFREKLQEFAQNEKMTVSDFLRKLVEEYERTHTHPAQKEP